MSEDDARAAIEDALVEYPQVKIETADQFKDSQAEQIDQLLVIITVLLGVRHHHRRAGDLDHPRPGGVRTDPGDRPDARRRHDQAADPPDGALGGDHRVDVRCRRRHRPRHADRHRPGLAVPDTIIDGISFSTSTIIAILIGAVLAGFIAALYPSIKASRMDVLEAIATE